MIDLFPIENSEALHKEIIRILKSKKIASGHSVQEFEKQFEDQLGFSNSLTLNNLSSALFLALKLSGVKSGDEVMTTPINCLSSTSPIANIGAKPVWIDFKPGTIFYDLEDIKSKISKKTKAIIIYHFCGYPVVDNDLINFCRSKKIKIIEDCNNALLAKLEDKHVGINADFTTFSFYPNRQINTIEGAMLCCKDKELFHEAKKLRKFGLDLSKFRDGEDEIRIDYELKKIGYSFQLSNLSCNMGLLQMLNIEKNYRKVLLNIKKIEEAVSLKKDISTVLSIDKSLPAYWVLLISSAHKKKLMNYLKSAGISASSIHSRNDIYSGFNAEKTKLKGVDYIVDNVFGIPCHHQLKDNEIAKICSAIENFDPSSC